MTVGTRIEILRRNSGLSQMDVAEQLNVSKQTVLEWEKDIDKPDIEKIILLAEIFHTTAEYIMEGVAIELSGEMHGKHIKRHHKYQVTHSLIICLLYISIVCFLSGVIYIHIQPVNWDAGACAGGYDTFIFDKYSEGLLRSYYELHDSKEDILSITALRGTQTACWDGRTIFLKFDIQYEHATKGTIIERAEFVGERIWIDTFIWGNTISEN